MDGPSADINVPPAREPDAVIEEKTDPNQTLLYRLSGDWNPLHADPAFAKAFGYDRPILHGLCTFGYCGRHVIKAFSKNDPRYFKSIKVRFAKNVFPGETLVTKMWKESDTRIVFETSVKERNEVVIKNAAVELYKEIPQPKAKTAAPAAAAPAAAVDTGIALEDVFSAVNACAARSVDAPSKSRPCTRLLASCITSTSLRKRMSVWLRSSSTPSQRCAGSQLVSRDVVAPALRERANKEPRSGRRPCCKK